MTKINGISMALSLFEEAASKHARATIEGDYKEGNKNYDRVVKAVSYLREQGCIDELLQCLNHDMIGVRLTAATFLLHEHEKEAIDVLEEISRSADFFSFIAETTLSEWRKGNMKL